MYVQTEEIERWLADVKAIRSAWPMPGMSLGILHSETNKDRNAKEELPSRN